MAAVVSLCGEQRTDRTFRPYESLVLACEYIVPSGVTVTILPGVTVTAAPSDEGGTAPAFIVLRGGRLIADGTRSAPITFTALLPALYQDGTVVVDSTDQVPVEEGLSGKWGGIVILGRAPAFAASPSIEGTSHLSTYGGACL